MGTGWDWLPNQFRTGALGASEPLCGHSRRTCNSVPATSRWAFWEPVAAVSSCGCLLQIAPSGRLNRSVKPQQLPAYRISC